MSFGRRLYDYFLFPSVGLPHPFASHVIDVAELEDTDTV
jgi:hypothetical protein